MMYIDWEGLAQGVACDPYFNVTKVLGHTDDGWTQITAEEFVLINTIYPNDAKDSYRRNIVVRNEQEPAYPGIAYRDTTITKFGPSSIHIGHVPLESRHGQVRVFVDPYAGALNIESNLDPLTADPFTQECWFHTNGTQYRHWTEFFKFPTKVDYNGYLPYWEVHLYDSITTNPDVRNAAKIIFWDSANNPTEYTATGLNIPSNTWHHLALVKHGVRDFSLFLNGIRVISHVQSPASKCGSFYYRQLHFTGGSWYLGTQYMPYLRGNMDEMRVSVVARYDDNFTVPTAAFPDIQCVYDPVPIPLTFYARDIPILDGYDTPKTLTFKAMDIPVLDGYDAPKTITFAPRDIPHLADMNQTINIGVTDGVPA